MPRLAWTVALLACCSGCAAARSPAHALYDGGARAASDVAVVEAARRFGAPPLLIKYLDGRYVYDFPSMSGYPRPGAELEPRAIEVAPGPHRLRVARATVGPLQLRRTTGEQGNLLSLRSAEVSFSTRAGLRYQLDCSGEAGDLQFLVRECDAEGKACAAAPTEIADVRAQEEWIPLGSAPFAARMMAR